MIQQTKRETKKMTKDYLAIVLIGAGSTFARGEDKDATVKKCARGVMRDWSRLFDVKGKEVTVNVFDVTGHDDLRWDNEGVFNCDTGERIDLLERVKTIVPKK
jgi:hypothetical protein